MKSGIDNIRERITTGLTISRVPKTTKERFLEIANEKDFCSDYGFTLKYLIDFHDGIIVNGTELLRYEIDVLRSDIETLKSALIKNNQSKLKKRIDGTGDETNE